MSDRYVNGGLAQFRTNDIGLAILVFPNFNVLKAELPPNAGAKCFRERFFCRESAREKFVFLFSESS